MLGLAFLLRGLHRNEAISHGTNTKRFIHKTCLRRSHPSHFSRAMESRLGHTNQHASKHVDCEPGSDWTAKRAAAATSNLCGVWIPERIDVDVVGRLWWTRPSTSLTRVARYWIQCKIGTIWSWSNTSSSNSISRSALRMDAIHWMRRPVQ